MIKKLSFPIVFVLLITAYSCKKGVDSYIFTRPTHPNNFKTTLDGDLYAYTSSDTAISRADYFMRIQGYLVNYGEAQIVQYGHCWKQNTGANSTPDISNKDFMTKGVTAIPAVADSIAFQSNMLDLLPDTEYKIASYVVTERKVNGKIVRTVGYNPEISIIKTRPAIDEWFEQCDECHDRNEDVPSTIARYDAIAFNLGDTVFFGTGTQGGLSEPLNDIMMYDPKTNRWSEKVITIRDDDFVKKLPNPGFMNGIGFAMSYQRVGIQQGKPTRSIFIGFGDHGGRGLNNDKSNFLLEYDLDRGQWHKRATNIMNRRSGAVCFVLNGFAYIGTGEGPITTEANWYVFDPVAASDNKPESHAHSLRGLRQYPKIPRKGAVAFTLGNKGYFGLGTDGEGKFYKDFWLFSPDKEDPTEGTWLRISDFPGEPRANAVAFTIGQFAYVGTGDDLVSLNQDRNFMQKEGEWKGTVYNDFYRFNPYTNSWRKVSDYTSNKGNLPEEAEKRLGAVRPITRAVGFSSQAKNIGFVGYGLLPQGYEAKYAEEHKDDEDPVKRAIMPPIQTTNVPAQRDFWKYQPFDINNDNSIVLN